MSGVQTSVYCIAGTRFLWQAEKDQDAVRKPAREGPALPKHYPMAGVAFTEV